MVYLKVQNYEFHKTQRMQFLWSHVKKSNCSVIMRMIPYKCKYFFLDFSKLILQRFWEVKLNVKAIYH